MSTVYPSLTTTLSNAVVALPLSDVDVEVAVDSFGFTSIVTQVFGNDHEVPIEVLYTFPLPGGVAVNDCTIRIGNRVLQAELKEIEQARREYDEAVSQGLTASIVEKELSEVFTVRVGNVAPQSEIEVQLVLHGAVDIDEGEATLRFPAVVAPKYSSPDAAAEGTDTRAVPRARGASRAVRTRFSIETADGTLGNGAVIRCTSHHEVGTGDRHRIDDIALDRDIVWRWPVAATTTQARWVPDTDDPEHGVIEVVVCEAPSATVPRPPVDVCILLDRSGSMDGTGQVIGNGIAGDVLASLSPGDTADVVLFDDRAEPLAACGAGAVRVGTAEYRQLVDEVGTVTSRGGTEMLMAIRAAARRLPPVEDGRDRVLVVITDGQFGNESEAVRLRRTALKDVRVVVLGVNMATSGGFLDELANGSYVELISDERRRVEVSRRVCSRIAAPLHAGLQIEGVTEPTRPDGADVYPGALVRLGGRLPRPSTEVVLVGAGGQRVVVPVRSSTDGSVRTRWAAARLVVLEHEQAERETIVELSVRHRVLCKHTAWVVVDREGDRQDVQPMVIVQPLEDLCSAPPSIDYLMAVRDIVMDDEGTHVLHRVMSSPRRVRRSVGAASAPKAAPRSAPAPRRPRRAAAAPDVAGELLAELRRGVADLRLSGEVTQALVDIVDRCRAVVSPELGRSLVRLALGSMLGPVQQRTVARIERLLEQVILELDRAATGGRG